MPTTIKALARGSFSGSNATFYTVPSATSTTVTNIIVCNTNATDESVTMLFDGIEVLSSTRILANSVITLDIKQTLAATKLITGSASTTGIRYHINGVEIS